jgi:2-oxoglutarate dehydrogenase E2 component (dihydrolipoamide succinyltransferase)
MVTVTVPALGENIDKATVTYWFVKQGDRVDMQADLVEISTDKAVINVPAPAAGVVKQIMAQEGITVRQGDALCIIE